MELCYNAYILAMFVIWKMKSSYGQLAIYVTETLTSNKRLMNLKKKLNLD